MSLIYRGYNETRGWVYGLFSGNRRPEQKPSIIVSMLTGYPKEEVIEVDPASVCKCVGTVARESYRGSRPADRMIFSGDILKHQDFEERLCVSFEDYSGQPIPVLLKKDGIYTLNKTDECQFVVRMDARRAVLLSGNELENTKITGALYETVE